MADALNGRAQGQAGAMARALRVIEQLEAKLNRYEQAAEQPIAIVGMACRMPGGANSPERLWELLQAGREAVVEVPRARWSRDPAELPEGFARAARWAGLLEQPLADFDAAFFGISPREAACLDPQQRLSLEVAWEALESARVDPHSLAGSRTGVFMGAYTTDFQDHLAQTESLSALGVYGVTGTGNAFTSGRLSYFLGLEGPALTVDTACSSSLVAVHLARVHLQTRQCDLALAGGVNVILSPLTASALAQTQALSPNGRCRPFDAGANGFVRGEGCGIVALKRLADAQRDGDPILATIRATVVNQDGRSSGLTAPNVESQRKLLEEAWQSARLDPARVAYLEAHGTGTPLGDPIEFEAMRAVFGQPRGDGTRCQIGSLKANLGHLEAAAGIAGLIKAVLVLRHGECPPLCNFRVLNPRIQTTGTALAIGSAEPLARGPEPLTAGVSAFGLSGTNAHVVLEQAPSTPSVQSAARESFVLGVSARSSASLAALTRAYRTALANLRDQETYAFCRSVGVTRPHHELRFAVAAASRAELCSKLDSFGMSVPGAFHGERHAVTRSKLTFVFPGTGGQWRGMALGFVRSEPAFRAALEACGKALSAYADWDLLAALEAPSERWPLDQNHVLQPALFCVQVAYARLWQHYGVVPDAVVGHSLGEIAAAHVAGILSLDDAARIVWVRAEVLKRVIGQGGMALVELAADALAARIDGQELAVAVRSSPRSSVVSGALPALTRLLDTLQREGVFARRIQVDYASHCAQMDELEPELLARIGNVAPQPAKIAMHSTLLDRELEGSECDARYWVANLRQPVRFHEAIAALAETGSELFVELGPHPVVAPAIEETLAAKSARATVVCSERRELAAALQHSENLARLYAAGYPLDWHRIYPEPLPRVALPSYPFRRERHWLDASSAPAEPRGSGIGQRIDSSLDPSVSIFQRSLRAREPLMAEHRVQDCAVLPAAAYLELAWVAAQEVSAEPVGALEDIRFEHALSIADHAWRTLQIVVQREDAAAGRFTVSTRAKEASGWTKHAQGTIRYGQSPVPAALEGIDEIAARCPEQRSGEELYRALGELGLEYGPCYRRVLSIRSGAGEALAAIQSEAQDTELCAPLLDGCLHAISGSWQGDRALRLPLRVERYVRYRPLAEVRHSHARSAPCGSDALADVVLRAEDGGPVAHVMGLALKAIEPAAIEPRHADWYYMLDWERRELPPRDPTAAPDSLAGARCWLFARGASDLLLAQQIAGELELAGAVPSVQRVLETAPGSAALSARWDGSRPDHVVYLDTEATQSEQPPESPCLPLLPIAQALAASRGRQVARLWLVTSAAQKIASPAASAAPQAAFWGFARSIAIEHPELRVTSIDVEARDPRSSALLAAELAAGDRETQLGFRAGARWVGRLDHMPPRRSSLAALPLREGCSYLVTGGLGGLGRALAGWLLEHNVSKVVLAARREPNGEERAGLAALQQSGRQVEVRIVDVCDGAALGALVAELAASRTPLAGVFHLAVELRDALLENQSPAHLAAAWRAKAQGAFHLHAATRSVPLDLFVVYSSAAGLFGSPGQANYAAACAYTDQLIEHRRSLGLPGLSIQWGAFAEVGLAAEQALRGERLASRGSLGMGLHDAHDALGYLLCGEASCAGVIPLNLRQWLEFYPAAAGAPTLSRLLDPARAPRNLELSRRLAESLMAAPASERGALLEQELRAEIAAVLRCDPERVERLAPFQSMGVDSLMGLELRNRLEGLTGVPLSAALLWTFPHLSALTEGLLERMALTPSAPEDSAPSAAEAALPDEIDRLSLDDVVSALQAEMGR